MTEEKEWVRLGGKDGVYLVEGEDYTVDREAGLLKINEGNIDLLEELDQKQLNQRRYRNGARKYEH